MDGLQNEKQGRATWHSDVENTDEESQSSVEEWKPRSTRTRRQRWTEKTEVINRATALINEKKVTWLKSIRETSER